MPRLMPPARPDAPSSRLAAPARRRGLLASRALGLALAAGTALGLGACDPLILLGNECRSQLDCEGASLCIDQVCVAQCRLDSECGDAGPTAVCRFNRCTVPVVFVDANLSEAGPGDLSVDLGADFSADVGPDGALDLGVDASVDLALPDLGADAGLGDLGIDGGSSDLGADADLSDLGIDAGDLDFGVDAGDLGVDLGLDDAATDALPDVIVPLLDMGP